MIVLDLPMPPSVNRIWRANKAGPNRVSKSPEYRQWLNHADQVAMSTGQFRGMKTIVGPFEATVILRRQRGDLDNRHKGLLDWLQSRGVIADDKYCERLVLEWGEAPAGCRVTIIPRPISSIAEVVRRCEVHTS
jgi:Holliday junction resolvase RusA-like endonuclease